MSTESKPVNRVEASNVTFATFHSVSLTDDDSIEKLFKSGQQSSENYNLKLAHQRVNAVFDKFLSENTLQAGITLFGQVKDDGFMEAFWFATFYVFRAGVTLKKEDIDAAREHVHFAGKMCEKNMKRTFIEDLVKLVVTPNYDKYSDVEVFAQLYYANTLALRIALDVMETNSLFNLFKLAYYLRGSVGTYNECWQIKNKRHNWESEEARLYFNALTRVVNGNFNLAVSHTPPKFFRIMNFFGFKGSESVGVAELSRVAFETNAGFASKLAQLQLTYYWIYAKAHVENVLGDLSLCKMLVDAELQMFPKSLLYQLARAKMEQVNGNFAEAIKIFNDLLKTPHPRRAYRVFYYELIWCHAIDLDWDNCIRCAEKVRASKHAPMSTTCFNAVFRYVQGIESKDQELLDQATKEFELIPSLRIRHFGKTISTEKATMCVSQLYFKKGKRLVLPVLELLYSSNYLNFIRSEEQLDKLMTRVEGQVQLYTADLVYDNLDDYLTALFYKGVLLRLKKQFKDARECHHFIINQKSRLKLATSIAPMAILELGLIEVDLGNYEKAKKWLSKAEKNYSGYLTENFVLVKVYAAMRQMSYDVEKQERDKDNLKKRLLSWLKFHQINF